MAERPTVAGVGEAGLIQRLVAAHGPGSGIGDDAALIALGGSSLLSVDSFVAGRHFDPARMSWTDSGYRAVAAALSDLAAMGGRPIAHLLALSLPPDLPLAAFDALAAGLAEAAAANHSRLIGGNLVSAAEVTITVSVAGEARRPVGRTGGAIGDRLAVTGPLGLAALGREAILAGEAPPPKAASAFLRPKPAWAAAALLADGGARALIDVTDGLAIDVSRLLHQGAIGAELETGALPLADSGDRSEDLRRALFGGDDYCLVAAVPEASWPGLKEAFAAAEQSLYAIGRLSPEPGVRLDGTPLAVSGYDHFA